MTKASLLNNFKARYAKIRSSQAVQKINAFLLTPWMVGITALFTLLAYVFALELVLYTYVLTVGIYVFLFGEDFGCLIPFFIFCYIAPAPENNPGLYETSIFYIGHGGGYVLILAGLAVIGFVLRLCLDKEMGIKRFLSKKRYLLLGMLILCGAYLLSGLFSKDYIRLFKNNLVFALLQCASVLALYFIFTATVKWEKFPLEFFAWTMTLAGLVVSLEVGHSYVFRGVIEEGVINRSKILTGWGNYNNVGAVIAMTIPFPFYLACKKKYSYIFVGLGTLLLCGVLLDCSRGAGVGGVLIYLVSFIVALFKCEHRKFYYITTIVFSIIAFIIVLLLRETLVELFQNVPSIFNEETETGVNDSGRINIYKQGIEAFLRNPIFGQTFYHPEDAPFEFSKVEALTNLIPARWHNTIVQLLASCGIVGILAYGFHRYQTIRLFIKKRNKANAFIALSIVCLLLMSLLDCHFFNLGPVLIYSIALAVAENGQELASVPPQEYETKEESTPTV